MINKITFPNTELRSNPDKLYTLKGLADTVTSYNSFHLNKLLLPGLMGGIFFKSKGKSSSLKV